MSTKRPASVRWGFLLERTCAVLICSVFGSVRYSLLFSSCCMIWYHADLSVNTTNITNTNIIFFGFIYYCYLFHFMSWTTSITRDVFVRLPQDGPVINKANINDNILLVYIYNNCYIDAQINIVRV